MADDTDFSLLRQIVAEGRVQWHHHALERLLERGIPRAEVLRAIERGEIIETYSQRQPFPRCLILRVEERPLHVVVAMDSGAGVCHVVSVYRPDDLHFEADFRTRRKVR